MKLTLKDVKVGQTYKMKNDSLLRWGVSKGDIVTCTYKSGSDLNVKAEGGQQLNTTVSALDFLCYSKADLEADLKAAEESVKSLKAKLKWMKDTNNEEFDEDEFKVWQVLETLDSKSTQADKAKAIAALIKSKR